jgi:hypothetical protein
VRQTGRLLRIKGGGLIIKKRLIFIIVLLVLFCAVFLIYNRYQYKEESITEVTNLKDSDITKIVLLDGRDLSRVVNIADKQKINEFMKLIDSDVIKKEKKYQYSSGWQNSVDFYSNGKKLKTITFTIDLEIDGEHYEIIKGDLTQNKIVKLMNSTICTK